MTKGPAYISHVGIRARNYEAMLRWYERVMGAGIKGAALPFIMSASRENLNQPVEWAP